MITLIIQRNNLHSLCDFSLMLLKSYLVHILKFSCVENFIGKPFIKAFFNQITN